MSGPAQPAPDRRWRVAPASIPRTRLTRGKLFAEIIEDRRKQGLFITVVQREGSPDILFLGQFRSRSEAETEALAFMDDQLGRQGAQVA